MVLRKPIVLVSGISSQLPPGDTIEGASVSSTATAGSGLEGGGFVGSDFRFDVALASAPSGLILTEGGTKLGIDGSAQVTADTALTTANTALASGNAAISVALTRATLGLVVGLS